MSRTIETILKLQGESAYRTGLKGCATEAKVLKSEMALVTSEYRTNANSMEALTAKGDVLSRMYENQEKKVSYLQSALEDAQKTQSEEQETVDRLREEYDQAKKALDDLGESVDQSSEEYVKNKARLDEARDALVKHQTKLDASTGAIDKYTIQLNRAKVELNQLGDEQDRNSAMLDEAKTNTDLCATSIDKYGDRMQEAADSTQQAGSAVEVMATQMVASGIQKRVEELAATMVECSEAAQEFEHGLAQVSTISDSDVLSTGAMREGVLQLSADLRRDANEMAEAVYNALSAGVGTADVLDFTAQSAQLAKAGFTDAATSVDVLTSILNAYKLEASQTEKVASALVKTQDLGKVTVDDLGKVIGRIIPSAAAYGVNLDNVAAAYANMTASGINAENTTTYMSTMLDELASSSSDVAAVLKEQTGQSFAELMASGKSLGDVLAIIGESVNNDQVAFSNLWSSATAGKGALALFDGSADAFNRTLEQMERSSGTVAKNYEKMTDVSEYSSQRLEVAMSNVKIAVGEQLNPVLDELREAGAEILEWATKVIDKNPGLVAAITGVGTAMTILGTGLAGLMIVKNIITAMQALNITMAANPALLIASAVAGLIALLATLATQTDEATAQVESMTEASRALGDTISGNKQTYDDSCLSIAATADTAELYIKQLAALEEQSSLTEEQEAEYAVLLDKIRTLLPDINIELDTQTGRLKDGAQALMDQVEGWEKAAKAEALYAKYKADITAVTEAEYELTKAKVSQNTASEKSARLWQQRSDVSAKLETTLARQEQVYIDLTNSVEGAADQAVALAEEERKLREELTYLDLEIEANAAEYDICTQAIETAQQAVDQHAETLAIASTAMEEMTGQSIAVGQASEDAAAQIEKANRALEESFRETYATTRESLDGTIGLFGEVADECDLTTDEMIQNLLAQQKAFKNYAINLQKAIEMGVDVGLVQKLSDGSTESMLILDQLVNDTELSVDDLNKAFRGVEESKDVLAITMSVMKENAGASADELTDLIYKKMVEYGVATVDGAIYGMESRFAALKESAKKMADTTAGTYALRNEIKSPSRRFMRLAHHDTEGVIVQYQADTPKLKAAAAKMTDESYVAAINARRSAIPSLSATFGTTKGSSDTETNGLLAQILAAVKAGGRVVLDSGALVGFTAGQYDAALGQNQYLTERGAK